MPRRSSGPHPVGTCDELNPNPEFPLAGVDERGSARRSSRSRRSPTSSPRRTRSIFTSRSRSSASTSPAATSSRPRGEERPRSRKRRRRGRGGRRKVTVDLGELNDSGVSGTATLTAMGTARRRRDRGRRRDGRSPGPHPRGHLRRPRSESALPADQRRCGRHQLDEVDVSLADLLASPYAINLHSPAEIATYVACGNIVAPAGGVTDTPATGVGTAFGGNSGNGMLLAGLGAAAIVLAGSALALRRREVRA